MSPELPQATLKRGREKSLRRRHPWIFSGAVERSSGPIEPGSTVAVVAADGQFLAWAAMSPSSQIRLRVWSFEAADRIGPEFLVGRLESALNARRNLGMLTDEGACRLVFGESDGLPGLIVDRYGAFLVCQFLAAGVEYWREAIVAGLVDLLAPAGVYERSDASVRRKEGLSARAGVLYGKAPPETLEIEQPAMRQAVDLAHGQKTGAYLDQRYNHVKVSCYARNAEVLDAFCHTGGFAIACLRAGARSGTLLDASAEALRQSRRVAALNGVEAACAWQNGDAFVELRAMRDRGQRYDLVVLEPPKFVHSADQIQAGARGYKEVNMLALQLLRPNGFLATFSCSGHVDTALFQSIVAGAAVDARRHAQIIETLGQPADHPIALSFPEAAYLKGLMLYVQ
jgi:23S rRNA (cytosine1962-C5)-methyltransferase